jgi:hypothetical protein
MPRSAALNAKSVVRIEEIYPQPRRVRKRIVFLLIDSSRSHPLKWANQTIRRVRKCKALTSRRPLTLSLKTRINSLSQTRASSWQL